MLKRGREKGEGDIENYALILCSTFYYKTTSSNQTTRQPRMLGSLALRFKKEEEEEETVADSKGVSGGVVCCLFTLSNFASIFLFLAPLLKFSRIFVYFCLGILEFDAQILTVHCRRALLFRVCE